MIAYITINIDPVIGHLGPFAVRWYPLIMALGVIVGAFIFAGQLRRKGIDTGHVVPMLVVVVPSAIVGARLFSVLDNWGRYSHDLVAIVRPPYVGLAIYGVLTGGLTALAVYCRVKKLPVLRVLDCLALAIPVGQIIGRCANIINGDTWGSPTHLPWGFVYTNPNALLPANLLGVPTHPTPVYEQLWLVIMVAILWICGAATEDRRHGHPALPRALLVRAFLHLVLPGQQHPPARPAGGAAHRPGRARGGGAGGFAASPSGTTTGGGGATPGPLALESRSTIILSQGARICAQPCSNAARCLLSES